MPVVGDDGEQPRSGGPEGDSMTIESSPPREAALVLPPTVDDLTRSCVRWATRLSVGAAGTALLVSLLAPGVVQRYGALVLAVGLLVGLPHGAVDHLVPGWAGARAGGTRLAAMLVGYLAVAALAFAVLRLWPAPALVAFLLVSAAHFGTGEVQFAALRRDERPRSEPVVAAAFGTVAALLPLVRWPHEVAPVLAALVPGSTGVLPVWVCTAALTAITVLVAGGLWQLLRAGRFGDAGELALLVALFTLAPPLVAFGVYFGAWHAVRHVARLLVLDPANRRPLRSAQLGLPLRRFAAAAAAPTLAALLALAVLWAGARGWQAFLAADLAVLAALTLPHLAVVAWLDRQLRSAA